jgi:hypothetical protein
MYQLVAGVLQHDCACLPAENYRITENWAAYIDATTGEGVGIYTPVAQTITCYRVGKVSHSSALQVDQPVTVEHHVTVLCVPASNVSV